MRTYAFTRLSGAPCEDPSRAVTQRLNDCLDEIGRLQDLLATLDLALTGGGEHGFPEGHDPRGALVDHLTTALCALFAEVEGIRLSLSEATREV